jgi:outer membrane immunogenic protein
MKNISWAAALAAGLFSATTASSFAADIALKARPMVSAPAWSWTGFYGGINAGYGVASDPWTMAQGLGNFHGDLQTSSGNFDSINTPKGGFVGLQSGYNYQIGAVVLGVEGDWQWSNQSARSCGFHCTFTQTPDFLGDFRFGASGGDAFSINQRINWFATARGRIGWTPLDGTMLYATAGGAWMNLDETDQIRSIVPALGSDLTSSHSFNSTKGGYAVGGGAEFRLWGNWTGKVEYLHLDVGGTTNSGAFFAPPSVGPFTLTTTTGHIKNDIFRVGMNYKVGPDGVADTLPPVAALRLKAPADRGWNWTGFYVGGNGGYGVANDDFLQSITRTNPVVSYSLANHTNAPKGEIAGLQAGYNHQVGSIVYGVEGDWQWTNQAARSCGSICSSTMRVALPLNPLSAYLAIDQRINWFATARGRAGWTPSDGTMIYATAGAAWMGVNETDTNFSDGPPVPVTVFTGNSSSTKSGYALGAGAEFRLWGNWTGKVEYLHLDVAGITTAIPVTGVTVTTNTGRIRDDIARVGLNYHIAGPVVAKY